ncbi:MAG: hypothetical protein ABJE66_05740 [Deltaproteobacteria bacterium]
MIFGVDDLALELQRAPRIVIDEDRTRNLVVAVALALRGRFGGVRLVRSRQLCGP